MEAQPRRGMADVEARLRHAHGHGRVAEVLYALACDALLTAGSDAFRVSEWEQLTLLMRGPISHAADEAIQILAEDLAEALGEVPPELAARVDRLRRYAEIGRE